MSNPTIQISTLQNVEWLNGSLCTYSLYNDNHIWRIRIADFILHIPRFLNLLTADEHERANRYYREKDKQRFIVSRALLRILLGKYLNLDAKTIVFEIGSNKKPNVKGNIHYNVSHSGDYILIAVSAHEVGVDVELPDQNIDPDEIMQVSYSKPEIDHVNASPDKRHAFYILWTRKEALLKATAKGIDDSLKYIPATDGLHSTMYNIIGSAKSWIVNSFAVDNEHIGSIASIYQNHIFWDIHTKSVGIAITSPFLS